MFCDALCALKASELGDEHLLRGQGKIRLASTCPADSMFDAVLCSEHRERFDVLVGLHPMHACQEGLARLLDDFRELAHHEGIWGLGEIGIDGRIGQAPLHHQVALFCDALAIAREVDKPIVLHVVREHGQALKCLRSIRRQWSGYVHGFSGSVQLAKEYAELGLGVSIHPRVLFSMPQKVELYLDALPHELLFFESSYPSFIREGAVFTPAMLAQRLRVLGLASGGYDNLRYYPNKNGGADQECKQPRCAHIYGSTLGET